jgi:hypothetical protein
VIASIVLAGILVISIINLKAIRQDLSGLPRHIRKTLSRYVGW